MEKNLQEARGVFRILLNIKKSLDPGVDKFLDRFRFLINHRFRSDERSASDKAQGVDDFLMTDNKPASSPLDQGRREMLRLKYGVRELFLEHFGQFRGREVLHFDFGRMQPLFIGQAD